jgi:hypothetical protein
MSHSWIGFAIIAAVIVALGCYVVARVQHPEMGKQAFALETAIRRNGLIGLDYQNVRVYAKEDGVVTLEGTVDIPIRKDEAEAIAKATDGVTQVINNIRAAGGS